MRIGLDARKLRDGGIGTYIRGLIAALPALAPHHRFLALLDPADLGAVSGMEAAPVRAGKYSLAEHWAVPRAARRAGVRLLHEPHYTLPLGWRGPSVVTIHDLIHLRFAHQFPPGAALYARAVAGSAARRARVVIADSECTARDVAGLLGVPRGKVRVVPLGVSRALAPRGPEAVERFRAARGLPADYVLYVGARKAHKNLPLLFRALAAIPPAARPPLVLSGEAPAPGDPVPAAARAAGVAELLHFSGPLGGDDDLACLYSGAALYAHPALYEGFGLPPLEAMACGVPVVSSTAGALDEVLGGAAVRLEPRDPERWAHEIAGLLGDRARAGALAARGRAHAAGFTWERTARATLALYEEAAAGG